ncbi:CLUMA_CG007057, isoform A [Clunio marinus]|uniref:CLUMA_CG007057, isoform A n=1 Tax=Clunio marinus TaxID=568069 RepID=A0A1J1I1R0_9DIPT|nr:CLUMA_CG007057, isoform A [Clunio marinus]
MTHKLLTEDQPLEAQQTLESNKVHNKSHFKNVSRREVSNKTAGSALPSNKKRWRKKEIFIIWVMEPQHVVELIIKWRCRDRMKDAVRNENQL